MKSFTFFFISTLLVIEDKKIQAFSDETDPKRNPVCFMEGRCTRSQNVGESYEQNEIECLKFCKSNQNCAWFSFKYENNFCELLNNCTKLEETTSWISGSGSCRIPECWINGKCLGTIYHSEKTQNQNECLDFCKSVSDCSWFTFYEEFSECVLYLDCASIDETCNGCVSGEHSCLKEEKPTGFTKLLVGTGYNGGPLDSIEVVDISSPTTICKALPNYPLKVIWSMGGLYNNTSPMICGGINGQNISSECFILKQNIWSPVQSMTVPRWGSSMIKYPSAKSTSASDLIVIGGDNAGPGLLSTLGVYGPTGWVLINSQVPEGVLVGCAITVNETTILMTGGQTDSHANVSSETFWFDSIAETWSLGPKLNIARKSHGCGKVKDSDGEVYLIVAGGFIGNEHTESSEILEPGSKVWKQGPKLPKAIDDITIVEDYTTNSVLLVGGEDNDHGELSSIYKLATPLTVTSQWEELPQKLQIGRKGWPVAFFIPDHFTDCKEN